MNQKTTLIFLISILLSGYLVSDFGKLQNIIDDEYNNTSLIILEMSDDIFIIIDEKNITIIVMATPNITPTPDNKIINKSDIKYSNNCTIIHGNYCNITEAK